jgi:hypothetical protein
MGSASTLMEAGFDFASLGDEDKDGVEFSTYNGPHIGVYREMAMGSHSALRPGLVFEDRGEKGEKGSRTEYARLTYLQVPLLARFHFTAANGHVWGATFGPEAGYLVRAKIHSTFTTHDFKESLEPFDFGLSAGADWEATGKEMSLVYGVAYYRGLYDIARAPQKIHNRGLRITLGVKWGR